MPWSEVLSNVFVFALCEYYLQICTCILLFLKQETSIGTHGLEPQFSHVSSHQEPAALIAVLPSFLLPWNLPLSIDISSSSEEPEEQQQIHQLISYSLANLLCTYIPHFTCSLNIFFSCKALIC